MSPSASSTPSSNRAERACPDSCGAAHSDADRLRIGSEHPGSRSDRGATICHRAIRPAQQRECQGADLAQVVGPRRGWSGLLGRRSANPTERSGVEVEGLSSAALVFNEDFGKTGEEPPEVALVGGTQAANSLCARSEWAAYTAPYAARPLSRGVRTVLFVRNEAKGRALVDQPNAPGTRAPAGGRRSASSPSEPGTRLPFPLDATAIMIAPRMPIMTPIDTCLAGI
jgi:hypothetical protein